MMNSFLKSMSAAASGMRAQGARMQVVSENIANTDTPGYHRKTVSFDNVFNREHDVHNVKTGKTSLDRSPLEQVYNPSHPMADENGNVEMSNVNLMVEMADGREASRSYEANLAMFQQARKMYSGLLGILNR